MLAARTKFKFALFPFHASSQVMMASRGSESGLTLEKKPVALASAANVHTCLSNISTRHAFDMHEALLAAEDS